MNLERAFHGAMIGIYKDAKEQAGYNAALFLRMVSTLGGLEAARTLIRASRASEGFTTLWKCHRLDITVEAVVLKPQFCPLFSEEELDAARSRLTEYGYFPPMFP